MIAWHIEEPTGYCRMMEGSKLLPLEGQPAPSTINATLSQIIARDTFNWNLRSVDRLSPKRICAATGDSMTSSGFTMTSRRISFCIAGEINLSLRCTARYGSNFQADLTTPSQFVSSRLTGVTEGSFDKGDNHVYVRNVSSLSSNCNSRLA